MNAPALYLTHPVDATTVHQTADAEPPVYLVDRTIPATSEAALAYIEGENAAAAYLVRVARDLAQPGELAARLNVIDPITRGFLARVEKCLAAHLREVRA